MIPTALLRVALSHARRRPLQSALLILGVALGVAVVVAIDLANTSALEAFRLSTAAVSGRSTHRIVGGPRGLDEALYARLRSELGVRTSAPVVEGPVAAARLPGESLTLLGVDPFAEAPFRDFLAGGSAGAGGAAGAAVATGGSRAETSTAADTSTTPTKTTGSAPVFNLTAFFTTPGAVLLSEDVAHRAGVVVGGQLGLLAATGRVTVTVAGILKPSDELSRRALDGMLIADISTAQELMGMVGRLDRIDLLLPDDPAARQAEMDRIQAILPPDAQIRPASEEQTAVEGMTRAFRLNLTALSLLALLVGTFLIFNTVRFSVVQRRPVIATLRAIGVTRGEIFAMILGEAFVMGLVGVVFGLVLGVVLGRAAVALVTRTINDLYFVVNVRGVGVPVETLVRGAVLGVVAAVGAAILPALEATGVPPITALRRSAEEERLRRAVPWLTLAAGGCVLAGVGLLALPGQRVDLGFASLAAIVLAFALATPAVTLAIMAVLLPLTRALFGALGRMAPRNVGRALSRTAVAIAALMVAVCVSIGVSLMVDSFRTTVIDWLASTLRADVFITSAATAATRMAGSLDPGLPARLAALPEVAHVATAHGVTVRSPDLGDVDMVVPSEDIAKEGRRYLAATGSAAAMWQRALAGAVMISEPFARRHELGLGDEVRLATDHGVRSFPVVGIYYDYGSDQGVLLMPDALYRANWDDTRLTSVGLFLKPGVDADAYTRRLRAEFGRAGASSGVEGNANGNPQVTPADVARIAPSNTAQIAAASTSAQPLAIQSNRGLRSEVLKVFDRAFAITIALQILSILVAFVGVLAALLALQLERAREFATLRAVGMTERQLAGLSLLETGLMGLVAGVLSWPAGLTLALILVYVINRRSFGWTIQFTLDPSVFARALLLAVAAALLAGLYPALRLRQMAIARGLREE